MYRRYKELVVNHDRLISVNHDRLMSKRGHVTLDLPSALVKYSQRVHNDVYDPQKNPKGFVDLGTADNKLMEDIIMPKLSSLPGMENDPRHLYYSNLLGLPSFRKELKHFIDNRFHPTYEIDPNELVVSSGTTAVLETLAFALAEHGDCMLVPTPYYYRIRNDLLERAGVECFPVPLLSKDERGQSFHLSFDKLERAYKTATSKGLTVSGLLLINPHNPLGDVYNEQQLMDALNFAHKYDIHVIVDEIYALSVFDKDTTFTSVLALPVPDPMRTHFVWGFSKDLGLSGYRCGILHSRNKQVIRYAVAVAIYHQTPALVQKKLEQLIADGAWLDSVYFPTYHQRLRDSYNYVTQRLEKLGVKVHPSKASLFVWVDMSKFLDQPTFEAEEELQDRFISGKVYILGGKSSYSAEPGWFRIVVSNKFHILKLAMDRVETVLEAFTKEKQSRVECIRRNRITGQAITGQANIFQETSVSYIMGL